MMIDTSMRRKLIAIAIALVAVIILAITVQQQTHSLASISPEYDSQRGDDSVSESVSPLYLRSGSDTFRQAFPSSMQVSILTTIYHKNYDLYDTISRNADMKGGVTKESDGSQSFTLLMGEQKQPLHIKVKVKNSATNDYTITVDKDKS